MLLWFSHQALRHSESRWLTRCFLPQAASATAACSTSTTNARAGASNRLNERAPLRSAGPAGPDMQPVLRITGPAPLGREPPVRHRSPPFRATGTPGGARCNDRKPGRPNAGTDVGINRCKPSDRFAGQRTGLRCFVTMAEFLSLTGRLAPEGGSGLVGSARSACRIVGGVAWLSRYWKSVGSLPCSRESSFGSDLPVAHHQVALSTSLDAHRANHSFLF